MFEFDKYEKRLHLESPAVPTSTYMPVSNVAQSSFLIWDEHCVECAAPDCFKTCDLYQPRPDLRCRRFGFGIYKNKRFQSLHGYGAEVAFKKWGKLEARGNLYLEPVQSVRRKARLIECLMPFASAVGTLMHAITRDIRWKYVQHSLLERLGRHLNRRPRANVPDAFLLEVYNPTAQQVRLQLNISWAKPLASTGLTTLRRPSFTRTVVCGPGYTRHDFESRTFPDFLLSGEPFDVALIPEAETSARLVFLSADFVKYAKPEGAAARPQVKCIVWDLDQTLWKGILVEDDNVELNPAVADIVRDLDGKGILHSIASKNDREGAWRKVQQLGLAQYFLYPQITWAPKSESIRVIAERLNIGLDTFAFVDDSPFELGQVSSALLEVTCIDVRDLEGIRGDPRFAGSDSADARNRRLFYQQAIEREEKQATWGDDYIGFLAACEIVLVLQPYSHEDLGRVTELVQRTNQLNVSGRKYTREEVLAVIEDQSLEKLVLACSDRYGSYGTVGFCLVRRGPGEIRLEDFMLSCRVQAKNIELALISHVVERHNPGRAARIWVNYRQTARNAPARQVLESLSFVKDASGQGMSRTFAPGELACDYIRIKCSSCAMQGTSEHPYIVA